MNITPTAYLSDLKRIARGQDRSKLVVLANEYSATLQQLPRLNNEIEVYLASEQVEDFVALTQKIRLQLLQASDFLVNIEFLESDLCQSSEIEQFIRQAKAQMTLNTISKISTEFYEVCQHVRQELVDRRIQEQAELERKAQAFEKAEANRRQRELERIQKEQENKRKKLLILAYSGISVFVLVASGMIIQHLFFKNSYSEKALPTVKKMKQSQGPIEAVPSSTATKEISTIPKSESSESVQMSSIEPKLMRVPSGRFTRGCRKGRDNVYGGCADDKREEPARLINMEEFWLGKYEITIGEWNQCVADGKCGQIPINGRSANYPITKIIWTSSDQKRSPKTYAEWLSEKTGREYRLPSEAEWEYAARGGRDDTAYPWGNTVSCDDANYGNATKECSTDGPKPVGSYPANGYGLHDMAGNVWEYCSDWLDTNYYKDSPTQDPLGPEKSNLLHVQRVIRGGSWYNSPRYIRLANRSNSDDNIGKTPQDALGFRLALDYDQIPQPEE